MATIQYDNRQFACDPGQTVLEVLLANGEEIPFSCKMGVCVTCVMQVAEGTVPAPAQAGLRASLAARGHFLPCVCQPTTDLRITKTPEQDLFSPAVVDAIEYLPKDICRVFLEPATPLYYRPGQFMNLRRDDGLVRSYSLASVPSLDSRLEFHVKRLDRGAMSNWILDDLRPGQHLGIQGPSGNCYYQPGRADQNMLLIGNGTGLAPLIGIARDALTAGHTAPIHLYHGSQTIDGLYLGEELRALAANHANLRYRPCVSREQAPDGYCQGRADDTAFADIQDLKGWRVFLCGYPPMVDSAKARALAAGASLADLYTDPYALKDLRQTPRP